MTTRSDELLKKRWRKMHSRCANRFDGKYRRYGARGIRVCAEWHDYSVFRDWAYATGYTPSLSLERVDNDGDYEPSNCRWATGREQARNTSTNHLVTAFGETRTLIEWSEDARCRVPYQALHLRLTRRNWEPERAISEPLWVGNRDTTACANGHLWTPANTRFNTKGWRVCRTCHRDRERLRGQGPKTP